MGVSGFLLGRNFLRRYNVLVDMSSMKVQIRSPNQPIVHTAFRQVSNDSVSFPVALEQDIILEPFERLVVKAKLMTENPDEYAYRDVMITFVSHERSSNCDIFLDDCLSAVRPGGILYLHLRNQVNSRIAISAKSIIGKAFLVKTVFEPITCTGSTEAATILD